MILSIRSCCPMTISKGTFARGLALLEVCMGPIQVVSPNLTDGHWRGAVSRVLAICSPAWSGHRFADGSWLRSSLMSLTIWTIRVRIFLWNAGPYYWWCFEGLPIISQHSWGIDEQLRPPGILPRLEWRWHACWIYQRQLLCFHTCLIFAGPQWNRDTLSRSFGNR